MKENYDRRFNLPHWRWHTRSAKSYEEELEEKGTWNRIHKKSYKRIKKYPIRGLHDQARNIAPEYKNWKMRKKK